MNKITKFILLVLGSLLFCFTATKAYLLSVTWDEAYSYTEYVRRGITFPTKFESMSANNHLLLTWMDVVLVKIFGLSEIVLRLPALMAHLIFLFSLGHCNCSGIREPLVSRTRLIDVLPSLFFRIIPQSGL